GCAGGRSACGRCRTTTGLRERERRISMSGAAAPLADLLQALAPPLEYLAADDFRRLDQTRLPLPALAERVRRARASGPPGAAGPLAELEGILDGLRTGGAREPLLRRAHALLGVLREAASAPSTW